MSSCSIESGGGELASVFREQVIKKSRKSYTCTECGRAIPIGSSYLRIFAIWDGDSHDLTICHDCQSVINAFGIGCYDNLWDDLKDTIEWCNADVEYQKLEQLTPIALEKVLALMQKVLDHEEGDV